MTDHTDSDLKLQHLVHDSLRTLPLRRAPASLEGRVLQELARRATLPWWRRSFAHWPVAVRSAFLALCVALSALTLMGGARISAALALLRRVAHSLAWLQSAVDAVGSLAHAIPTLWLYEGLAIAALLYGFLIALGTAAYRTLYLDA